MKFDTFPYTNRNLEPFGSNRSSGRSWPLPGPSVGRHGRLWRLWSRPPSWPPCDHLALQANPGIKLCQLLTQPLPLLLLLLLLLLLPFTVTITINILITITIAITFTITITNTITNDFAIAITVTHKFISVMKVCSSISFQEWTFKKRCCTS